MAFMFVASLALHALLLYSAYQCAPAEVVSQGFRSVSFRAHKGDRLLQPAPATAKSVTDAGAEQAAKVADRTTTSRGRGIVDLDASGLAFTQQTCYMDTDESEQCVYDDAICFDGTHPVMLVGHTPRVNAVIDSLNDCMDYRYLEPSIYEFGECKYATSGERFYKPEDHPEDLKHGMGKHSSSSNSMFMNARVFYGYCCWPLHMEFDPVEYFHCVFCVLQCGRLYAQTPASYRACATGVPPTATKSSSASAAPPTYSGPTDTTMVRKKEMRVFGGK